MPTMLLSLLKRGLSGNWGVGALRARAARLRAQGYAHWRAQRFEEALRCYEKAYAAGGNAAEIANNIGLVLNVLGRETESHFWYRKAARIDPHLRAARWNCANAALCDGDFENGWVLYEQRLVPALCTDPEDITAVLRQFGDIPHWRGESLIGRKLLIWTEQGMGDNLMMMRYLPLFSARFGCTPDVWCEPELQRLFAQLPGVGNVYSKREALPAGAYDVHSALLSLPWHFRTRADNIPGTNGPYLSLPAQATVSWRERCAPLPGKKIGLFWSGNTYSPFTFRLRQLAELLAPLPHSWINLQWGTEAAQVCDAPILIHDWMHACMDFFDTAALVSQLDAVIGIDTSVAHLAGALGKPQWLLMRMISNWRWRIGGIAGRESPWYSQVKIFRQQRTDDWTQAIDRLVADFARVMS